MYINIFYIYPQLIFVQPFFVFSSQNPQKKPVARYGPKESETTELFSLKVGTGVVHRWSSAIKKAKDDDLIGKTHNNVYI